MGDAAVSALVEEVLGTLASFAVEEFSLLWGFKKDILALEDTFKLIQAVLQDAEAMQRKNKSVEEGLRRLRAASFEVENVLDEVSTEVLLKNLDIERGIKHRVNAFFSSQRNPLMFRTRMAHEVKNIRKKLQAIAADRSNFGLTPGATSADLKVVGEMTNRQTTEHVNMFDICGRNEETDMIVEKICKKGMFNQKVDDPRVYAVWGMGGVGKTLQESWSCATILATEI